MNSENHPLILFHDMCMDGLVAAWVAWRRFLISAEYVAVRYGEDPPNCKDRPVYILDFCYSPELTNRIADEATTVVILDHHKTAVDRFQAAWKERADVVTLFDITRSGAQLAAAYFNAQSHNWIIDYVEDRDLWKFSLPQSREVNAAIAAYCMGKPTLDAFKDLDELRGFSLKQVAAIGAGAQLQIECYARQVAAEARRITFVGNPGIPIVNLAKPFLSDTLHLLTSDAAFAVGWHESKGRVIFSLRSVGGDAGFDCAALAEQFGGGGHHNAAGFTASVEEAIPLILGDPLLKLACPKTT